MTTAISQVTICHHINILHSFDYIPHCIFHTGDFYFATWSLYFFISLTSFFPPPTPLPSGNHLFVLCIYNYVLFIHLFCFLDSKYKWNHPSFDLLHFNLMALCSVLIPFSLLWCVCLLQIFGLWLPWKFLHSYMSIWASLVAQW